MRFLTLLICPLIVAAQSQFTKQMNVPITRNGLSLRHAWAGGLNNPQFSAADLNNDGIKDLVIFDRNGDKALTFLNGGAANVVDYTYQPEYESAFSSFKEFLLMLDFDCDGIDDVLAYGGSGNILFYKGNYNMDNQLRFDSIAPLQYLSEGNLISIFNSYNHLPAIADINNDGDLDVLNYNQSPQIFYYENRSRELTGTCADTNLFELASTCWGDVTISSYYSTFFIDSCFSSTRDSCISGLKPEGESGLGHRRSHDGITLHAFDEDSDGDQDLLVGMTYMENLIRLVNGGDENCADMIAVDNSFPAYDAPYDNPLYANPFVLDVNNDGLKDLLVAPNETNISETFSSAWYYKNIGTPDSAVFNLQTKNFLLRDMPDFGSYSHPVFFDYNNDGLLDIVVGNYGYYINGIICNSALALLQNTGSTETPSFTLVDTNYIRLDTFERFGTPSLVPAFGDMDADGDKDMVLGDFEGYLHYFENTAGFFGPAQFVLMELGVSAIDVGQNSTPTIYDVNGDGLNDLLVGEKNGNINYFENYGTATAMQFDTLPTNSYLGRIDVREPGLPSGYSTPVITPLDSTGKLYLVSGSLEGYLHVYEFNRDSLAYDTRMTHVTNRLSGIDEGERSVTSVADLNGDGSYEMVVGNARGGISLFSQKDSTVISAPVISNPPMLFQVYPNPATNQVSIKLHGVAKNGTATITLFDMAGRTLAIHTTKDEQSALLLPPLNSGMYFIRAQEGANCATRKLLIRDD